MNIGDMIRLTARKYPNKTALIFGTEKFTYSQFNTWINQVANVVRGLGFTKGEKLAIMLPNCPEFLVIFFALAKIGVVPVPLNPRGVSVELEYVLDHSDSTGLIMDEQFIDVLEPIIRRVPGLVQGKIIVVGNQILEGCYIYESLLSRASTAEPVVEVSGTDCLFLAYTAGTTGKPKGVPKSHVSKIRELIEFALVKQLSDQDVELTVMPLYHSNGLSFSLLLFYLGGTVVLHPHFDEELVLRTIHQEKVTFVSFVPTMFVRILQLPQKVKDQYDVRSMRVALSSSAPLLTQTKLEIMDFFGGLFLHENFGSTEQGPVTHLRPEDQIRKVRCVGQPFHSVDVKLLGDDFQEVPPGEVGEIWARSPYVFDGYYKDHVLSQHAIRAGWVGVGDMGRMDEEGYLYLVDRKNDMIISGGENIYPTEVEEHLATHPKVSEVAVVGVPDPVWGEAVKAVVVLRPGMSSTQEELIEWCRGRMAGYKKPKSVDFCSELPKSATGKILRRKVREPYWKDSQIKI